MHLHGSVPARSQFPVHLLPMIRVICERAIDFAQCELRMIQREFLGAPSVGNVLLNKMIHLEILPGNERTACLRAIQVFISNRRY